jgi:hypothetical protein
MMIIEKSQTTRSGGDARRWSPGLITLRETGTLTRMFAIADYFAVLNAGVLAPYRVQIVQICARGLAR